MAARRYSSGTSYTGTITLNSSGVATPGGSLVAHLGTLGFAQSLTLEPAMVILFTHTLCRTFLGAWQGGRQEASAQIAPELPERPAAAPGLF